MINIKDRFCISEPTIYSILVKQIYSRATVASIATVINASILVFILRKVTSHTALKVWFALIMLVTIVRVAHILIYLRSPGNNLDSCRSEKVLIIGVGISGVLWGSTAIFLFPNSSLVYQSFIAFVLAGMVAGAVGVFSAILPVFLSFTVPALTPLIIRFMIICDEIHTAMGLMILLFGILAYITARQINKATKELVRLKETFANQLDERTLELKETNHQLNQEAEKRINIEKALITERDKLQEMLSEIKILRGFLPICASCKKIRDDKGYWQKIEKYIQDRSEAKFSHSICPECTQKLYPYLNDV